MAHVHHESHHLPVEHEAPDEWHRHTVTEGTPQAEHGAIASPGTIAKVFVAMTTTVVGSVLVVALYFNHTTAEYRQEITESTVTSKAFNEYKSNVFEKEMSTYGWADPTAGTVRIPIDKAMEKVVARYGKK